MKKLVSKKLTFLLFLLLPAILSGQSAPVIDSLKKVLAATPESEEKVRLYYELYRMYLYQDSETAESYVQQGYDLSKKMGYERGIILAYDKWGGLAAVKSDFYRAFTYYLRADSMLQNMDWPREQAVIYGNLAANYKDLGVFDSATIWNQRFLEIAHELENQDFIAFGLTLQGDIYYNKGQNELAARNYMKALRIYESTSNQSRLADAHRLLAAAQTAAGSYGDSERNLNKAIAIYTSIDDLVYLSQSYRDMGNTYFLQEKYAEAEENNQRAVEISQKIEDSWGIGQARQNLGDIAVVQKSYEQAERYYLDAMERYQNIGSPFEIGLLYTDLAELYLKWGELERALAENQKAEENLEGLDAYSSLQYLYKNYYEIYAAQDRPESALTAYQTYVTIKDSLLTVDKQVRIDELQLIYEVEKKDQAIELLSKDLKLATLRRQLFGVGLISIALIAGLVIFTLIQRRRKERRIQEERHKRQAAELEKKELARAQLERELAAQVLQLVRKNEMLARVQKEVVQLSKKMEGEPQSGFRKLERSIQNNLESDEDWKQFLSTFKQVHPAFLRQLRQRATKLSPAEQKLSCLLRMNLSSKEIATLLNISDEGVKKGRYRLRKKLGLDSDINLQAFLINLPGSRSDTTENQ